MKKIKEYMIPLIITFGITSVLCVFLLYITGMIPRQSIEKNIEESAEYFYEQELFPYLIDGQFNTRQDNYADSILVNIIYHIDETELFASLMEASYYQPKGEEANVSLYEAVKEEKEANIVYDRYWHGSMILLRPLLIFTNITGVRLILGITLCLLILGVSYFLYRKGEKGLSLCYLIANLLIQVWMCAFCIEYITTFLITNAVTLATIFLYEKKKNKEEELDQSFLLLMCISGTVTCFFDFLTTETLTITVPLLVLLVLLYRDKKLRESKQEIGRIISGGCVWGFSYGLMFCLKWGLSSVVLGKNAFSAALSSVEERMVGTVHLGNSNLDPEAGIMERLLGVIGRNQGSIFPFREEMSMGAALAAFFGILFLVFAIIYLFRGKNLSLEMIFLCSVLSVVPYLRYLVLSNHSYIHYFFTYRAQLVVILSFLFCSWEFGLSNLFTKKKQKK